MTDKKHTILIVDDQHHNINILVEILGADHRTVVAKNGKDGLRRAMSDKPPDLILLDIMMPEMDGYEVCRRLKAEKKTEAVPVIFVSAMGDTRDEAMGLELGAADYIVKPIRPAIVRARVRHHLERKLALDNLEQKNTELTHAASMIEKRTAELTAANTRLTREIAEHRLTEEKLRQAKNYLENVFENSADVIVLSDETGRFVKWNRMASHFFGYDTEEFGQKQVSDICVDKAKLDILLAKLWRDGFARRYEMDVRDINGKIFPVEASVSLLKDDKGKNIGSVTLVSDMSELKSALNESRIAKEAAEAANNNITESIQYARTIQQSLLPNPKQIRKYLPHSFVIWHPSNIVGGDIFYLDVFEKGFILAVVDCTGHGIPGAFMTMIASSGLRRITRDEGCHDPAEILGRLSFIVKTTLQQDTAYALSDNGLDAAICFIRFPDHPYRQPAEADSSGLQVSRPCPS